MTTTPMASRLGVFLTPTFVLVLGMATLARHPDAPGGWLAALMSFLLGLVAVFDFPLGSRAGPTGVSRRCLGRTHSIDWSNVAAIEIRRASVTAVTTRRRRYLLAAGTSTWLEHPETPAGVAVREVGRASRSGVRQ